MTIKIFSKVLRTDLCKQNSKNVVFEPGINKMRRGSKVWLGFDGTYLISSSTTHASLVKTEVW